MQRLEVSGAVRPLLGSLGFKGLNTLKAVFALSIPKNTCVRGLYRTRNLLNTKLVSHHSCKITGVRYEFKYSSSLGSTISKTKLQPCQKFKNNLFTRIMTTSTKETEAEKFLDNYARFSFYGAALRAERVVLVGSPLQPYSQHYNSKT